MELVSRLTNFVLRKVANRYFPLRWKNISHFPRRWKVFPLRWKNKDDFPLRWKKRAKNGIS